MGEMLDSDWSREILLRSDWSGLQGATITTLFVPGRQTYTILEITLADN